MNRILIRTIHRLLPSKTGGRLSRFVLYTPKIVTSTNLLSLQFVFTGNEIPDVGTVTLSWYTTPGSAAPTPYVKLDNDGLDAKMEGGDDHQTTAPGGDHRMDDDSYDLAEDDQERWE